MNTQRKELSFKGQKVYVGIDVHKSTWSVTSLMEIGVPRTHTQKASAKELFEFLNRHYPEAEYYAAYEAGFSGFSTYYELKRFGINCIVVNPADIPTTQYESVMKTDAVDSVKIAKALRSNQLRGIYIRDVENLDDRSVVRLRKTIRIDMATYKIRVKHMLLNNGVELPPQFEKSTYWSKAYIKWLREDVKLMSSTRISLDLLISQVETIRENLLKATLDVRRMSQNAKYKERYDLLHSIPGLGPLTIMTILTEIYDINRFHNERQFASYLGLVPTCHSSGDKIIHGEKTFRRNKKIGPELIEASWTAIYRDEGLSLAFCNYRRRGQTPQEAIVRIARKLSNIIYSVLKNGHKYTPYMAAS